MKKLDLRFLNWRRCNSRQLENVKRAEPAPGGPRGGRADERGREARGAPEGEGQEAGPKRSYFHLWHLFVTLGKEREAGFQAPHTPRTATAATPPGPALAGWTAGSEHGVLTAERPSALNGNGADTCYHRDATFKILRWAPGGLRRLSSGHDLEVS